MEDQGQTSITIGGRTHVRGAVYWCVVAAVALAFLAVTFAYWRDTVRIIDESSSLPQLPAVGRVYRNP